MNQSLEVSTRAGDRSVASERSVHVAALTAGPELFLALGLLGVTLVSMGLVAVLHVAWV